MSNKVFQFQVYKNIDDPILYQEVENGMDFPIFTVAAFVEPYNIPWFSDNSFGDLHLPDFYLQVSFFCPTRSLFDTSVWNF